MTQTANIHYGLSGWVTGHSYALGARVSSTGTNAYQCIISGTSGATAPSGTGASISDGGATWKYLSHIDYTDVQSWASGLPSTLSQPCIGQLWNNVQPTINPTLATFGQLLVFSGHTTSATNTITLTCAPGESFRDKMAGQSTALAYNTANGVSIQLQSSGTLSSNVIEIDDANVIIDGIQYKDPNTTSNCTMLLVQPGAANSRIQNCIIEGTAQNAAVPIDIQDVAIMANCLVIDHQSATGYWMTNIQVTNTKIVNCTFVALNSNTGTAVLQSQSATVYATNCISVGYSSNAFASGGGAFNIKNCLVSTGNVGLSCTSVSGNLLSKTAANQFVSATTDFRLKTTADAKDAGFTDSTDIPSADDIAKTSRPQGANWDIGAWEFKNAAVNITPTGITGTGAAGTAGHIPATPLQLLSHTKISAITTATTPAIDTTGANLLVVVQSQYSQATTATISDSKGNVWSFLTPATGTVAYTVIGYIATPVVGTGHTFTKTISGNDYGSLLVLAFTGGGAFSGMQTEAVNISATTSLSAGSVTPPQNGSLIISGLCAADNSALPYTVNSGLTVADSAVWVSGSNEGGASAYLVQAVATAINPSWSWTTAALAGVVNAVFNPSSIGTKVAPAQAVAAGFTALVFDDDFTTNTVLANSGSASTVTDGFNWYWKQGTAGNISVNTTATAASISNSNTRGGNYASSAGGILTLTGVASNPNNLAILQSVPPALSNGANPPNAWQHYYAEAYMQFTATTTSTSGWVGFWSWALNGLFGELYTPGVQHTELDMAEYYSTTTAAKMTANVHEWSTTDTSLVQSNFSDTLTQDSNWHVYGCLWTGNGTTGNVTFYRDNVAYATLAVGSGSNYPSCESSKQYFALSAGQGWSLNFDWIRVWQTPVNNITPTGITGTGAAGTAGHSTSDTGTLSGVVASASQGSLTTRISDTGSPTGVAAAANRGTLTTSDKVTFLGVTGTGGCGIVGETFSANVSGVAAAGIVSSVVVVASGIVAVTGVSAFGQAPITTATMQTNVALGVSPLGLDPLASLIDIIPSPSASLLTVPSANVTGISTSGIAGTVLGVGTLTPPIANIHIGLGSWHSSQAYNPGDRTNNSNNAYQCVTGGTSASSGGPSGTRSSINDGSVVWKWLSHVDYANLQAWANAIPPSPAILTQPYVGLLWNDGAISITNAAAAFLTISNHNTTSTNTITLTCAPGESIRDTLAGNTTAFAFNATKGVSFILPNAVGGQNYFDITDANVIFDGLQFADPSSVSDSTIVKGGSSTILTLRNCIFDGYAQTGAAIVSSSNIVQMANCLVVDRQGTSDNAIAVLSSNAPAYAVNCTFVSINSATGAIANAFSAATSGAYTRNCIFSGYLNSIGGAGVPAADHCVFTASSVGTSGVNGSSNKFSKSASNQFVSTTADFRTIYACDGLDAGSADLTDLPTGSDIAQTLRPQGGAWDIGAWELIPLASGAGVAATGAIAPIPSVATRGLSGIGASAVSGTVVTVIGANASVSLTGVVAIGTASSPTTALQILGITGVNGTGWVSAFTLIVPAMVTILGVSAATIVATALPIKIAPSFIAGISASAAGNPIVSLSGGALIGISASASVGVPPKGIPSAMPTGGTASGQLGNPSIISAIPVGGVSGTGDGDFTFFVALNGISASTKTGNLSASISAANLLGVIASGQLQPLSYVNAIITGTVATGSSTSAVTSQTSVTLTGCAATASSGNVATIRPSLPGVGSTGQVGVVATSSVVASVLSNIHFGLSAWVTATGYSLGNRISKSGNAYQCILAGTSSGGPTGTGNNILDGTARWKFLSSIDFTSIQAWANAIPSTLPNPIVGQLWNDAPITTSAGTSFVSLHSHITNTANTITLTCAPGESFRDVLANGTTAFAFDTSNGVAFTLPSGVGNTVYFDITDANVILDGFQIQDPYATSNSTLIQNELGASNFILQNCIIDGYAQPGAAIINSNDQIIVRNCLLVDRQATASSADAITILTGIGSIFINNTIVNVNANTNGAALVCNTISIAVNRNNYFIGYAAPISGNGGQIIPTDHCAFSQASLTYIASAINDLGNNFVDCAIDNQFISASDFRTTYAASGLDHAFTDISDLPSLQDISYGTRYQGAAWDIGAWELTPFTSTAVATGAIGALITTSGANAQPIAGGLALGSAGTPWVSILVNNTLLGANGTGQAGTLGASPFKLIAGQVASGQRGIFPLAQLTINIINSGTASSALIGSLIANPRGVPTSVSAFGWTGNVTAVGLSYGYPTGVVATTGIGTVIASNLIAVSGTSASGSAGSLLSLQSQAIVNGQSAVIQIASLTVIPIATPLGVVAAGQSSTISLGNLFVRVSGTSAVILSGGLAGVSGKYATMLGSQSNGLAGQLYLTITLTSSLVGVSTSNALVAAIGGRVGGIDIGIVATGQVASVLLTRNLLLPLVGISATAQASSIVGTVTAIISGVGATANINPISGTPYSLRVVAAGQNGLLIDQISILIIHGVASIAATVSAINFRLDAVPTGLNAIASVGLLTTPRMIGVVASGQIAPTKITVTVTLSGIVATAAIAAVLSQAASFGTATVAGVSAAVQPGFLALRLQTISGLGASASIGSLISRLSVTIVGTAATSLVGSLSARSLITPAITGVTALSTIASATALGLTVSLTGVPSTATVGNVIPGNLASGFSLVSTASVAPLALKMISIVLLGVTSNTILGSLSFTSPIVLAGIAATASIGSVMLTVLSPVLGLSGGVGTVSSLSSITKVVLTGVSAASRIGDINAPVSGIALGILAAGAPGTTSEVLLITLTLAGCSASSLVGTFVPIRLMAVSGVAARTSIGTVSFELGGNLSGITALLAPQFRRASIASYVDASGVLRIAGTDVQRINHTPSSPFVLLGVMTEAASINYMPQSTLVGWSARNTTVLTSGYSSPDGLSFARFMQAGVGSNIYDASSAWGGNPNTIYTHSVYAKANGYNYLHMQTWDFGVGGNSGNEAWFDLGNGSVMSASNGGPQSSGAVASISLGPNGFYRCVLTGMPATNATLNLTSVLRLSINGSDNTIVGNGVSGILVWGDQIEASAFASSYIPTSGSIVARAADIPVQTFYVSNLQVVSTGVSVALSPGSLSDQLSYGGITGVASPGQATTVTISIANVPNLVISASGQSGALIASGQTKGLNGVSSVANVAGIATQVGTIPLGVVAISSVAISQLASTSIAIVSSSALARSIAGNLGEQLSITLNGVSSAGASGALALSSQAKLSGVTGGALVGNLGEQLSITLNGVSSAGASGSLTLSSQAKLSGVTSSALVGGLNNAFVSILLTGINASTAISNLSLIRAQIVPGITAAGTAGTISLKSASIVIRGMAGAILPGTLGRFVTTSIFLDGTAHASVGTLISVALQVTLTGCVTSGQTGATGFAYLTRLSGVVCLGHVNSPINSALTGIVVSGVNASLQTSVPKVVETTLAATGCSASASCGAFGFQHVVFPVGVAANAASLASRLPTQSAAIVTGAAGSGFAGTIPQVQLFVILSSGAAQGGAGKLTSPQSIFLIGKGQAANASCGSINDQVWGSPTGVFSRGLMGALSARSVLHALTGAVAIASVGAIVPRATIYPPSVSASASAGNVTLQTVTIPVGVAGTGEAGISHGWLVIANVVAVSALPQATAYVSVGAVMDDEPMEISVYAVPQVVQLLYPVRGVRIGVFAIPQLVNTVINDG